MESKKFKLTLKKEGEVVFEYTSKKNDSLIFNEKNRLLCLNLKGDQCKEIETKRFNTANVKSGKNELQVITLSYKRILDNGITKLTFNLKTN